jgi:hypothetical protein
MAPDTYPDFDWEFTVILASITIITVRNCLMAMVWCY